LHDRSRLTILREDMTGATALALVRRINLTRVCQLSNSEIISIVDDDASVRVATDRLVRSLGWRACTFASGTEFLQSPQLTRTRCLVTDVEMPHMDGLELQRRLIAQGHRIRIIFMTAFPNDAARSRAMAAGAVCFMIKPFDALTLSESIETALWQHSQECVVSSRRGPYS
jgi:FixJ family two-component response regulator